MAEDGLRLIAQDADDLAVLAAATQDSVFRAGDVSYDPHARSFTILLNRFRWEQEGKRRRHRRVRAALSFNAVLGVRRRRFRVESKAAVADLLTIVFEPGAEPPGGVVRLVMAGDGEIRLDVECIDAALLDLAAEWATSSKPQHGRE